MHGDVVASDDTRNERGIHDLMARAIAALAYSEALLKAWLRPAQTGQADVLPFVQQQLRSLLTVAFLFLAIVAQSVTGINEDRYVIGSGSPMPFKPCARTMRMDASRLPKAGHSLPKMAQRI